MTPDAFLGLAMALIINMVADKNICQTSSKYNLPRHTTEFILNHRIIGIIAQSEHANLAVGLLTTFRSHSSRQGMGRRTDTLHGWKQCVSHCG